MEKEIYLFMKELFKVLIKNSKDVENIDNEIFEFIKLELSKS